MRERLEKADAPAKVEDEEDPNQVFRLTDITTREVSLVDRGANGHRFLLVKRSDEMAGEKGQKVVTGENGELEVEGGASSEPETLSLTKAAKESILDGVKKAVAALAALQTVLEKATEVEEGEVPEEVGKALVDAATFLVEAYPGEEAGVDVEKVGRKMAGGRMKRLQAALKLISDLVKEVGGAEPTDETKDEKADAKKNAENAKSIQDAITEAVTKALEGELAPVVETLKAVQEGVSANSRKVEEISKTTGGSRQPANADELPTPKPPVKKGGFHGGDLNASELPASRRFDG